MKGVSSSRKAPQGQCEDGPVAGRSGRFHGPVCRLHDIPASVTVAQNRFKTSSLLSDALSAINGICVSLAPPRTNIAVHPACANSLANVSADTLASPTGPAWITEGAGLSGDRGGGDAVPG